MTADPAYRTLEQRVAEGMPVRVVDRLQADDVDVGDGELAPRPADTVDLVVEIRQSRPARARARQRVGLGGRQMVEHHVAVRLGLEPVASSVLAVMGRLEAIGGGPGSTLRRRLAVCSGTPAILCRTQQHFLVRHRTPVGRPGRVAGRELAILRRGGLISRQRR